MQQKHDEPDRKPPAPGVGAAPRAWPGQECWCPAPRRAARRWLGAGLQSLPVLAFLEVRRHRLATDVAGEPVRDELLQRVADFHADASVLHGKKDQRRRFPCRVRRCRVRRSRTSSRRTLDIARLHGVDRRDHEHVARGLLEARREIGNGVSRGGVDARWRNRSPRRSGAADRSVRQTPTGLSARAECQEEPDHVRASSDRRSATSASAAAGNRQNDRAASVELTWLSSSATTAAIDRPCASRHEMRRSHTPRDEALGHSVKPREIEEQRSERGRRRRDEPGDAAARRRSR